MSDVIEQAGMLIRRHIDGAICRTCARHPAEGEWVFAASETGTQEWHRDCSTREYRDAFDKRVAKLEAR